MGSHLSFWHGAPDGLLGHFLGGPLEEFEKWLGGVLSEAEGGSGEEILALLREVRRTGADALQATTRSAADAVDALLDHYYWTFCPLARRDQLVAADPARLNLERYRQAFVWLRSRGLPAELASLWKFLLDGRPILRDAGALPCATLGDGRRLAYWTVAEVTEVNERFGALDGEGLDDSGQAALLIALRATSAAMDLRSGLIAAIG